MSTTFIRVQSLLHNLRSAADASERIRSDLDELLAGQPASDSAGPRLRLWFEILGQEAFAGSKDRDQWLIRAKETGMGDDCLARLQACLNRQRVGTKPCDDLIGLARDDVVEITRAAQFDRTVAPRIDDWIVKFAEDSARANAIRHDLIEYAAERIEILSRKMLRQFPAVRRLTQTADVFVASALRLRRALCQVSPLDPVAFFGLVGLQIRRELIDLARSFKRRLPPGPTTPPGNEPVSPDDPRILECWTRYHTAVEQLPAEEKEVVDLFWYQGLKLEEIAELVGVGLSTIKRRWRQARRILDADLKDCADIMLR